MYVGLLVVFTNHYCHIRQKENCLGQKIRSIDFFAKNSYSFYSVLYLNSSCHYT